MIQYFEGTNPELGITVKVNEIYRLYTKVVREYLGARHMDMVANNVSIGGVDTHIKVTDGKKFYSIRIEKESISSFNENYGEFDNKLSLMVIEFDKIGQDFLGDGNSRVIYTETFYQLGNLLYKKDIAQKLNPSIRAKRIARYENHAMKTM